MKLHCYVACILILSLALSLPSSAAENAVPKAVVLDLSMNGGVVNVVGSQVLYSYPPDNRATDRVIVRMLDANGTLLLEQGIDDPRIAYVEEGVVIRDNVNFSVIVPFRRELATISLVNGTDKTPMLSADVAGSVISFCNEHKDDPDCGAAQAAARTPVSIATIILAAAATGCALVAVRRR